MIELQPLAVSDLSFTYARKMEGNKIRHYKVTASDIVMSKFTGKSCDDVVKEYILKEEGEEATVLPYKNAVWPKEVGETIASRNAAFQMRDISKLLLENNPEIEKALRTVKVQSQLYQYNVPGPWYEPLWNTLASGYNFLIAPINHLLAKLQGFKNPFEASAHREMNDDGRGWHMTEDQGFFLPHMQQIGYARRVSPCSYLSISFEEDFLQEAVDNLLSDLKILHEKDLIMGHLTMPGIILLADTIGSGKSSYAIFCFLFVDQYKLCEITGKTFLDLPKKPLELIGVKTEAFEGGLGGALSNVYEIEPIYVSSQDFESRRQAYIENYLENVEHVNKVAKKVSEGIEKVEVLNKTSSPTGFNGKDIAINADIIGPDGQQVTLGDLYSKNS